MPDKTNDWLDQSKHRFETLILLASRQGRLFSTGGDQEGVFKLHALGVTSVRGEWVDDFYAPNLTDKDVPEERVIQTLYRPFVAKWRFADSVTSNDFARDYHGMFGTDLKQPNKVICFCANDKDFYALATDRLADFHLTGDTQCLPLYRYTPDGERVSNITEWGWRLINEHYRKEWGDDFENVAGEDGITAEDIFAYTYAVLHDPVYRHDYAVDLLREFPRLPLYHDFDIWARMGRELLDLHIGFESVEPYPLQRIDQEGKATRTLLRADKELGTIALDDKTTLTGVPADAWRYLLGNRSALEWVLDQYKERKPRDPTIAEKFNTYRFADYKERVIDLLMRVCTVSVKTMDIVDGMAYWEGCNLIVSGDRDKFEMAMLAMSDWFDRDEDEDWLSGWSET